MELTILIWSVAKYILLLLIAFILYQAYILVYKPWRVYQACQKYPNVETTDRFYPLTGDFGKFQEYADKNIVRSYDYIKCAIEKKHKDLKLMCFGPYPEFHVVTIKAFEELERLIPDKVDRHDLSKFPIGYVTKDSLLGIPSHDNWKLRRASMLKLMGLNTISDYFSIVVKSCHSVAAELKEGVKTDFTLQVKKLSFRAMSQILFGNDIKSLNLTIDHYNVKSGDKTVCELEEMMLYFVRDVGAIIASPIDKIFPLIKTYPICQPYKSLRKNCDNIFKVVKEVCEDSKDGKSIYKKAIALGTMNKEDVFNDIVGLLFAGTDTTADAISSCLYFIKKNKNVFEKLMKEMKSYGLDELKNKNLSEEQLKEIYIKMQECDYLTYVVKEGLRIDSPAQNSIRYIAKENIQLCGVPISKGTIVGYGNYGPMNTPEQWHKPNEFIPERFDPNSEYFNKPDGSGKPRHPKSWVPFSNGIRTCPGKVLAIFEIKATLATLLHLIDYDIDKDLLANDTARFNMLSQYHACGKVNKIY